MAPDDLTTKSMTEAKLDPSGARNSEPPPEGLSGPALAVWHEARGDWHAAHALVQDDPSRAAARVHAYLHRREGDEANARYWYARAGAPFFAGSLDEERQVLLRELAE